MRDIDKILNSILDTRGTTLCLGYQVSLFSAITDIDDKLLERSERVLVIHTDSANYKSASTKWYVWGMEWRIIMLPSHSFVCRNVAFMSVNTWNKDIDNLCQISSKDTRKNISSSNIKTRAEAADAYISSLRVYNVRLVDGFPFISHNVLTELMNLKSIGEQIGVPVGIALVAGLFKYSSTDISTEEEAIEDACNTCNKMTIPCMVINKKITDAQISEFYTPISNRLSSRLGQFKEECRQTKENLSISKDIMGSLLMIGSDMSLQEYVKFVQSMKDALEPMLPILKYIGSKFYDDFKKGISPIFNNRKESNIIKDSDKCAEVFCNLILKWIK